MFEDPQLPHYTTSIHSILLESSQVLLEFSAFCNRSVTFAAILWNVSSKHHRVTGGFWDFATI